MFGNQHIIKTQVIELDFPHQNAVIPLQRAITKLIERELNAITESCLDDCADVTRLVSIDKLELNLPVIPFEYLDKYLPQRYEEALRKALKKYASEGVATSSTKTGQALLQPSLHGISSFLVHGALPWNYAGKLSFKELFAKELKSNPAALLVLLQELLPPEKHKLRLINALDEPQLIKLIEKVEPGEAALITAYQKNWMQIQTEKRPLNATQSELSQQLWLFILKYLYDERGSYFNKKAFLLSTLRQIAIRFNVAVAIVLKLLRHSYELMDGLQSPANFTRLINDITQDLNLDQERPVWQSPEGEKPDTWKEKITRLKEKPDELFNMLWANQNEPSEETILYLLLAHHELLRHVLKRAGKSEKHSFRLFRHLSLGVAHQLIKLAEPAGAEQIINFHRQVVFNQSGAALQGQSSGQLSAVVWSVILVIITAQGDSQYNRLAFVEAAIRRLAVRYKLDYKTMLQALHTSFWQVQWQPGMAHIFDAISTLHGKELGAKGAEEEADTKELRLNELIDCLKNGLLTEQLSEFKNLKELLLYYLKNEPGTAKLLLRKAKADTTLMSGLLQWIDGETIYWLAKAMKAEMAWAKVIGLADQLPSYSLYKVQSIDLLIKELCVRFLSTVNLSEKHLEKTLLLMTERYGVSLSTALNVLTELSQKAGFKMLNEPLMALHIKYVSTEVHEPTAENTQPQLKEMMDMVLLLLQGKVDIQKVNYLGFASGAELLRYLLKNYPAAIKSKLGHGLAQIKFFPAIGRDITHDFFYELLQVLFPGIGHQLRTFFELLHAGQITSDHAFSRLLHRTYQMVLSQSGKSDFDEEVFLREWTGFLNELGNPLRGKVEALIMQKHVLPSDASGAPEANSPPKQKKKKEQRLDRAVRDKFFNQQKPMDNQESTFIEPPQDEFYLENAGMILINAFYPRFFQMIGLMEDGNFKEEKLRHIAAYALQYVISDNPPMAEEGLVLNKLLAGLQPEDLLEHYPEENEVKEIIKHVHEMLQAVIAHWQSIGTSSVDGFRGNWCVRQGKLVRHDEYWQLYVERKPYDLLIDQLPFSYTPVNYSWLEKPIVVDWR